MPTSRHALRTAKHCSHDHPSDSLNERGAVSAVILQRAVIPSRELPIDRATTWSLKRRQLMLDVLACNKFLRNLLA